jgi:hypothetical protein
MAEQTNRANLTLDERVAHEYELRKKREAWEAEQNLRKDKEQRDEKQARLEAHLRRRSEEYQDTVGSSPPMTALQEWTMQFMNRQEQEYQAAREARLRAAEENYEH